MRFLKIAPALLLLALSEAAAFEGAFEEDAPLVKETSEAGRPLRRKKSELPPRLQLEQRERARGIVYPKLPGFQKPLTQSYIKRYTTRGNIEWLASCLKNGEMYLAFIRAEIRARGMPEELLYLPVMESGFYEKAHSRSGARGIWQFMQNSIRPFMKIDDWRDERLDFWKSTNAALSKLEANYKEFGNWELALAAYNSGSGALARAIKSTGVHDYWELCEKNKLKSESIYYVPKLLAIYFIVSNPRMFALDICYPARSYNWTKINLSRQVNLSLLAEHSGADRGVLEKANSELLFAVTPPGDYELKVLAEDADAVRAALERDDIKLLKHYIYTIKSGDTLSALSVHYGVSVAAILGLNPGVKPELLRPGTSIIIPAYKEVPPYKGAPKPKVAAASAQKQAAQSAWKGKYTVKKGDTLWSISRAFKVSVEDLAKRNGIGAGGVLKIGSVLSVP